MVKSIAVASGKGGVGKTSIAVNTSIKLAMENNRVALLDADFGLANAHIMLNQKVQENINDVLEGNRKLDEIICDVPPGLKLIPGGSGVLELMNINSEKRWEIIRSVDNLRDELDFLIVDTPAGASDASIEFASACDKIIIVLVGEPTSFMDAYAFIKALHLEKQIEHVSVFVNMAKNQKAAVESYDSFKKIVLSFLSVQVDLIGWLPNSYEISNSILSRKPFILKNNLDPIIKKSFSEMTEEIYQTDIGRARGVHFFDQVGELS